MTERVLFESIWLLGALWIACQFCLIGWWSWRRSRLSAKAVWCSFAALPALVLVSLKVVTDREQVITQCIMLGTAIESGDVMAVRRALDNSFQADTMDADRFVAALERKLEQYKVKNIELSQFKVAIDKNRAVAEFRGTCGVHAPQSQIERVVSRWQLEFQRSKEAWLLSGAKSIPTPPLNFGSISRWLD